MNAARSILLLALAALTSAAYAQANWLYADLHDFGAVITDAGGSKGQDGCFTEVGVTFDSAGNMYGVGFEGGAYGFGMVWEITASGTYKDLHDFGGTVINADGTSGPDGNYPIGGVTVDGAGNLYGTTQAGGPNKIAVLGEYGGIVWEITSSGSYKDLHDFGGATVNVNGKSGQDGYFPYASVTFDSAGNKYGTTSNGGPNGIGAPGAYGGILWEITASGIYKDLHDFGGTVTNANGTSGPDGVTPQGTVAFDGNGNMYGATTAGGPNRNGSSASFAGMVWEITASGNYLDLHDFGGAVTNANGVSGPDGTFPWSVNLDSAGNLYGLANTGGPYELSSGGAGMLWEITTSGTYRDLHDFGGNITNANGMSGADGLYPYGGVAFDKAGDIFGTGAQGGSNNAGMVWEIMAGGTYQDFHDFGGTTINADGISGPDGVGPGGSVAFDSVGNLYGTTTQGGPFALPGNTRTCGIVWRLKPVAGVQSLVLSPTTVQGGASAVGTVTLSQTAPLGGLAVPLVSSSASATVPATVTVAAGATTATFTVGTDGVNTQTAATITAGSGNVAQSATLTITPAVLTQLSLSPSNVGGGLNSTGTVTLSGPAGPGGTSVTLTSSSASVQVPTSAVVPAGQISGTFTITTSAVNVAVSATVTATLGGTSKTATLSVKPAVLESVSVSPSLVLGGSSSVGTVSLSGNAYTGGFVVTLSSSNAVASVPKSVTIKAGQSSATFAIKTTQVTTQKVATITAKNGSVSKTATLTVAPPALVSISLSPSSLAGGATSVGVVTLSSSAGAGGILVNLASNSKSAAPPASVRVPAGKSSATFKVKTTAVATQAVATLTASFNGVSQTATLTINAPALSSLSMKPASVKGGKPSTGTVTLTSVAPVGGLVITLSSDLSSATVPATVKVLAGKTSAAFSVKTTAVSATTSATITGTLGNVSKTAVLAITH